MISHHMCADFILPLSSNIFFVFTNISIVVDYGGMRSQHCFAWQLLEVGIGLLAYMPE
jgi:hypothetical protein